MLKKRLIFKLLYDSGNFCLSRNFRLQKVGDLHWLKKNYDFDYVSNFIDELIVLDVSRKGRDLNKFSSILKELTKSIFIPISSGGGISNLKDAKVLLDSGADKIILNSSIFKQTHFISELSKEFGSQCIIGSFDLKRNDNNYEFFIKNGSEKVNLTIEEINKLILDLPFGEIIVNSIDKVGTGQGYDFGTINSINKKINKPIIISGGAGNNQHLISGLLNKRVDAVSTSHLFNFVGDGLKRARKSAIQNKISIPIWG